MTSVQKEGIVSFSENRCGWINRTRQRNSALIHTESDVRVLEIKVTEDNDQYRTMFSAPPS